MVSAAASEILRTHGGDQRGDGLHLSMQEKLKAVAQDFFGHDVGILAGGDTFASETSMQTLQRQ